ncbi:MAG TPA: hypothetical protein VFE78_30220 [Gemmataceae bacterium]|jgi:hypothetical protein|nr:hypothetical protein [Gemmataceae bacterium]
MRRLLFVLSSVGLLGVAVGCNCMKGVCDCDYTPWGTPIVPVNAGPALAPGGSPYAPTLAAPGIKAEPIKEMPKSDSKPLGGAKAPDKE